MACRRMPAGCQRRGRPAMGRITAIAACRPLCVAIVDHFSTPSSIRCLCGQPDTAGASTIGNDDPCRTERVVSPSRRSSPRTASWPAVQGSLPIRPDATSSTFVPGSAQGAGQLRARPVAQGFRRTSVRRDRAGQAESYETETCRARTAAVMRSRHLAGQGARAVRKIFPARAARRDRRLRGGFPRPPTRNVSRALHAARHARAGRLRCCFRDVQPTRWWSASPDGEPSFPPLSPLWSWSLSPCSIIIRYSVTREMPSSAAALLIR